MVPDLRFLAWKPAAVEDRTHEIENMYLEASSSEWSPSSVAQDGLVYPDPSFFIVDRMYPLGIDASTVYLIDGSNIFFQGGDSKAWAAREKAMKNAEASIKAGEKEAGDVIVVCKENLFYHVTVGHVKKQINRFLKEGGRFAIVSVKVRKCSDGPPLQGCMLGPDLVNNTRVCEYVLPDGTLTGRSHSLCEYDDVLLSMIRGHLKEPNMDYILYAIDLLRPAFNRRYYYRRDVQPSDNTLVTRTISADNNVVKTPGEIELMQQSMRSLGENVKIKFRIYQMGNYEAQGGRYPPRRIRQAQGGRYPPRRIRRN